MLFFPHPLAPESRSLEPSWAAGITALFAEFGVANHTTPADALAHLAKADRARVV